AAHGAGEVFSFLRAIAYHNGFVQVAGGGFEGYLQVGSAAQRLLLPAEANDGKYHHGLRRNAGQLKLAFVIRGSTEAGSFHAYGNAGQRGAVVIRYRSFYAQQRLGKGRSGGRFVFLDQYFTGDQLV